MQDVLVDFEFELSPPYLLYRTGNEVRSPRLARFRDCGSASRCPLRPQVNGLWFYQQEECDKMTFLLKKCAQHATCA